MGSLLHGKGGNESERRAGSVKCEKDLVVVAGVGAVLELNVGFLLEFGFSWVRVSFFLFF
jgi:hypothetical protein